MFGEDKEYYNPKSYYHIQKTFLKLKHFLIDNYYMNLDKDTASLLHKVIKEHEDAVDRLIPQALEDIKMKEEWNEQFNYRFESNFLVRESEKRDQLSKQE